MSLTKAVLTSPDENPFGKPVYVRGVLYLDDVPEDDSANDAGDSSVDKPGDADNGEWVINPKQAEIVRYIFERYVCGVSATAIAKELNAMGKKTVRGSIWRADAVLFILRNEKYVGDCESQKTVTKNFLTHEVSINEGDAPKYYVTDHHVAIIDRHTWNQAQMMLLGGEEARDKKEKKRRANNASPFTNLTYGVDGCNEPMFRIGYNTPLYTYTDERSAKAEP